MILARFECISVTLPSSWWPNYKTGVTVVLWSDNLCARRYIWCSERQRLYHSWCVECVAFFSLGVLSDGVYMKRSVPYFLLSGMTSRGKCLLSYLIAKACAIRNHPGRQWICIIVSNPQIHVQKVHLNAVHDLYPTYIENYLCKSRWKGCHRLFPIYRTKNRHTPK